MIIRFEKGSEKMQILDWGMCGTIVALIAFGYSIWVENKLKKLNDHVANLEKERARYDVRAEVYENGDS